MHTCRYMQRPLRVYTHVVKDKHHAAHILMVKLVSKLKEKEFQKI